MLPIGQNIYKQNKFHTNSIEIIQNKRRKLEHNIVTDCTRHKANDR